MKKLFDLLTGKYYIRPMHYQSLIFGLSMLALFLSMLVHLEYYPLTATAGLASCAGCSQFTQ